MNKIILSIHEPCSQSWDAMSETEKGRFCSSCAKEVIDFTALSDEQLIHYFLNKSDGETCGRVFADQLDTEIAATVIPIRKRFGYWKYIAASALLFFAKASVKAQARAINTTEEAVISPSNKKSDTAVFNALKTLEGVTVTSDMNSRRMMGAMSFVRVIRYRTDTLRAIVTSITGVAKIFPNPVPRGNSFNLSLNLSKAGAYFVEIISTSGILLTHEQIAISAKKSVQQIQTNSTWVAGTYFVRVLDADKKQVAALKLILN